MTSGPLFFPTRDGIRIEALLELPDTPSFDRLRTGSFDRLRTGSSDRRETKRLPAVVITHSHPLQAGGHMFAHVLRGVASYAVQHGFAALRFNFRGVQQSEGTFAEGVGELNDVGGAVDYLRAHPSIDPEQIALFGYSFGSRVCLPYAATDPRIRAVATLGMPARRFLHAPVAVRVPLLLIAGDGDQVIPPAHIEQFVALHPTTTVRTLTGTDHFYRGRESEVGLIVAAFLSTQHPALASSSALSAPLR